jgi:hypothetical protein
VERYVGDSYSWILLLDVPGIAKPQKPDFVLKLSIFGPKWTAHEQPVPGRQLLWWDSKKEWFPRCQYHDGYLTYMVDRYEETEPHVLRYKYLCRSLECKEYSS